MSASALLEVAVGDVVQHQHVDRRHVLDAGCGHATHHPAREGMPGNDHPELELGQLRRLRGHQVLGRHDAVGFTHDHLLRWLKKVSKRFRGRIDKKTSTFC
jgi:hypothetical protein